MNVDFQKAREKAGFSKRNLSITTGINRGTIYRIENKGERPELETAVTLADHFGITNFEEFKKIFLPEYSHEVRKTEITK